MVLFLGYIALGLIFFLLLSGPLSREKDLGRGGALLLSIFWPVGIFIMMNWMQYGITPPWRRNDDPSGQFGGPSAYKRPDWTEGAPAREPRPQQDAPPKASYNQLVFGDDEPRGTEEEIDDDDVEAFIAAQFGHQSAPLPEPTTITYKRTGVSKTYPAGALFPDAFIADWKAGFFSTAR